MKTVAIYSRKSRFTGTGDSVENQVQICRDYFASRGESGVEFKIFEDEGFSGKDLNRPEFQEMMCCIRRRMVDAVICYRLDRLSRNVSDFSNLLETLQEYNVDFISVKENFDTSTPMGRAMTYIASVFAQLERETIAERVRDNKLQIAKSGRWQGGTPPFGYRAVKATVLDEEGKKRSSWHLALDVESEECKFALRVFKTFRELCSTGKVQKYFMEHGVVTPNGKAVNLTVIKQILSNPVYAANSPEVYDYLAEKGCILANAREEYDGKHGLMAYGKTQGTGRTKRGKAGVSNWIVAIGQHEPLVSGAEWVAGMNALEQNAAKAPRMDTSKFALFSGMVRCACGSKMIVKGNRKDKNGNPLYYYKCIQKDRSGGALCDSENITGPQLDKEAVAMMKKAIALDGGYHDALQNDIVILEKGDIEGKIQALEMETAEKKRQIEQVVLQLATENISDVLVKQIDAMVNKLQDEMEQLNQELEALRQKKHHKSSLKAPLDLVKESLSAFLENFDTAGLETQKEFVTKALKEIRVNHDVVSFVLFETGQSTTKGTGEKCNLRNNRYPGDNGGKVASARRQAGAAGGFNQ